MRIGRFLILAALCLSLLAGCTLPAGLHFPWTSEPPADTARPDDTVTPVTDTPPAEEDTTAPDAPPEASADSETESDTADIETEEAANDTTLPPDTEVADPPVILPSLIGQDISVLDTLLLHRVEVECLYEPYDLPAGTIFQASFDGVQTETEFLITPDTQLTLHVSLGTALGNITVDASDKTVYLTFDDGPSVKNTRLILDILDAYGVKGTFFLVGTSVKKYPELVREIYERGHKIGCHSYSHVYSYIYENEENMLSEIAAWEAAVADALGYVPTERLFRFPGGSTTCKTDLAPVIARQGYRMFDWNMVSNDCMLHTRPEGMTPEDYIKDSVISTFKYSLSLKTSPHILLMHDTYAETAELLPWLIEYLTEQGCTFATLDALPGSWLH